MPKAKSGTFEAGLKELEETVRKLESGDRPLEETIALYERGIELAQSLEKQLETAALRVKQLTPRADDDMSVESDDPTEDE